VNVVWEGFDHGSGMAYYEIKIDGNEYDRINSTNYAFSGIAEGSHDISLKAFDHLGNSKELKIAFIVDMTPPTVWVTFPNNGSEVRTPHIKVAWDGSDELSGIDHYEIRLDKNPWTNVSNTTAFTFSQLSDGNHRIDIKAVDKAGNYRQVRFVFSVNTSLIGKPGWTDDIIVFSSTSAVIALILVFLLEKHVKSQPLL
jgi:hypothetical protein